MRSGLNSAIFQNPSAPSALQLVGNLAKETKHADVKQESQNCHGTDSVSAAPLPGIPECGTEENRGTLCEDAERSSGSPGILGGALELCCCGKFRNSVWFGFHNTPRRCIKRFPDVSLEDGWAAESSGSGLGSGSAAHGVTEHTVERHRACTEAFCRLSLARPCPVGTGNAARPRSPALPRGPGRAHLRSFCRYMLRRRMVARSRMLFPPSPPTRSAETREHQPRSGPARSSPVQPAARPYRG